MTDDIDKFARKVTRVFEAKIVDKRNLAKHERGRARKAFHEGQVQALSEAAAVVRDYAGRWEP